jgi:hypothetical protein
MPKYAIDVAIGCKVDMAYCSANVRLCGLRLLTGPFQMMWMETDRDILATFGDARREYECSEEPAPRLNKFDQDP